MNSVNVRYMVDDVAESVAFYTEVLGFEPLTNAAPAFAAVTRGQLRLLLAGPASSAGRPMPDGAQPGPGGWNRIHFVVDDLDAEVSRLRDAGARVPQRRARRTGRQADPASGSVGQRDRVVPTAHELTRHERRRRHAADDGFVAEAAPPLGRRPTRCCSGSAR